VKCHIVQQINIELLYLILVDYKLKLFYKKVRGIGTDIAIVSCMVFLAQFILSLLMGSFVTKIGESFVS